MVLKLHGLSDVSNDTAGTSGAMIIAAGPLTIQPMTRAYRVVLCQIHSGFVVWYQYFEKDPDGKSFFEHGKYFGHDSLVGATQAFCDRLKDNTKCFESLYREEDEALLASLIDDDTVDRVAANVEHAERIVITADSAMLEIPFASEPRLIDVIGQIIEYNDKTYRVCKAHDGDTVWLEPCTKRSDGWWNDNRPHGQPDGRIWLDGSKPATFKVIDTNDCEEECEDPVRDGWVGRDGQP